MSPSPSAPAEESPAYRGEENPKVVQTKVAASGLFLPPKGPAAPLPPPSPSSSTSGPSPSSSSQFDAEVPTWSDGYADSEETSGPDTSSDTPSTADSTAGKVSKAGLRAVLGQAVRTVTGLLAVVAADAIEQQHDLWRADPVDVEGMATPAARMVWRRVPAEARDSDAVDLFGLALATGAYLVKNFRLKAELRALRATGEFDGHTGVFVPSGDAAADAAAADAWGVPGYPAPAP